MSGWTWFQSAVGPTWVPLLVVLWISFTAVCRRLVGFRKGMPLSERWRIAVRFCMDTSPAFGLLGTVVGIAAGLTAQTSPLVATGQAFTSTIVGMIAFLLSRLALIDELGSVSETDEESP